MNLPESRYVRSMHSHAAIELKLSFPLLFFRARKKRASSLLQKQEKYIIGKKRTLPCNVPRGTLHNISPKMFHVEPLDISFFI